ncbi:hypothetical protein BDZ97DRAFT_1921485 [Flammula alnicola]|nr:hypothetical protein BDZ97DRAFT_1921485 [Flammula alnicola]
MSSSSRRAVAAVPVIIAVVYKQQPSCCCRCFYLVAVVVSERQPSCCGSSPLVIVAISEQQQRSHGCCCYPLIAFRWVSLSQGLTSRPYPSSPSHLLPELAHITSMRERGTQRRGHTASWAASFLRCRDLDGGVVGRGG